MSRRRILMTITLRVVLGVMVGGAMDMRLPAIVEPQASQDAPGPNVGPVITTLLALHNQHRAEANLPPLTINARLTEAAQIHAQYMAEHNQATHQGRHGTAPAQRVEQQGYPAMQVAENIASGQDTPEAVMQSWIQSPPHRQNIVGHFSDIGAARATSADGTSYWCVVFGLPRPTLDPSQATARLVTLLNQQRVDAGLSPLQVELRLAEAAQVQARTMAARNALQHQKSDSAAPLEQLQQVGYRYRKFSQGTLVGAPTPEAVVQGLLDNATHKQHVLGDFTEVGVGYAAAADGTPYWSLFFGMPQR
jgi:uncharacterized protein YkwD